MSALPFVSDTFDLTRWRETRGSDFADVTYHRDISRGSEADGRPEGADVLVVRIAFDYPDIRSTFRPGTVDELYRILDHACQNSSIAAVILAGNGPSTRNGGYSFCSGDDQRVRGRDSYRCEVEGADPEAATTWRREQIDPTCAGRLHILEVQCLIRTVSKIVIAAVLSQAAGSSHSLNVVADLPVASIEHATSMQTDANVGSFGTGYGSVLPARQAGNRRAREISLLTKRYDTETAECWGVINQAVPHAELGETALEWAATIATRPPQAIRIPKFVFNLADNGLADQQVFAGEAMRMTYMMTEAQEGRDASLEHRAPRWENCLYYY